MTNANTSTAEAVESPSLTALAQNILDELQEQDAKGLEDPALTLAALSDAVMRTEDKVADTLRFELEPAGLAIEVEKDRWCLPADPEDIGEAGWVAEPEPEPDYTPQEHPALDRIVTPAEPDPAGNGDTDMVPAADGEVEVIEPLTDDELAELARLEAVVADGAKAMCAAGVALAGIRDKRLYRADFTTFDEYVEDRLGVSTSHAYRWMDWAQVQANVASAGLLIERESHARELSQLSAGDQVEVYRRAQEGAGDGRLTAKQIAEARDELMIERVVAIIEASDEPLTGQQIAAQMDGVDEAWKLRSALLSASGRGLIHVAGNSYPETFAAGKRVYSDQKITIPAALVERHAKAGVHQTLEYWVRGLVEAALDAAEAGAPE